MRQRRWFAGLIPWAVAVGALALVCVARSSRADDKSDLIRRIEDLLEDAGDALERLPGDAGDGPIGYADRYVQDARRAADDLARVAGDDASAKRLADDFDDIQDDWNEAAGYLRQLKGGARQLEQVAQRCVDSAKELLEKARGRNWHTARGWPALHVRRLDLQRRGQQGRACVQRLRPRMRIVVERRHQGTLS